jgi:hypothetical protein
MAASLLSPFMVRQSNGTGKGGKSFQDRELVARVRTLGLNEIEKVLSQPKMSEFKKHLLLRLAGSLLLRLNEHTGEDGGAILIKGAVKEETRKAIEVAMTRKRLQGNQAS